jgi:predicted acylesterase/phospholipase RssA
MQPSVAPSGPVDALVLGGGGAKCIGHVALWRALTTRGIRPRVIAGTSAGALVGLLCAVGLHSDAIKTTFVDHLRALQPTPLSMLWGALGRGCRSHAALLRPLERAVQDHLGFLPTLKEVRDRCGVELIVTATDLTAQRSVVYSPATHPAMSACLAASYSALLPFEFAPVRSGDALLVDGGITANVPVDVMLRDARRPIRRVFCCVLGCKTPPTPTPVGWAAIGVASVFAAIAANDAQSVDLLRARLGDRATAIDLDTTPVNTRSFDASDTVVNDVFQRCLQRSYEAIEHRAT